MRSQTDFLIERAYEQVFRDLLLGRAQMNVSSTRQFFDALGGKERGVFIVVFRRNKGFNYLEQFAVSNMLDDLLPAGSRLLTAGSAKDVLLYWMLLPRTVRRMPYSACAEKCRASRLLLFLLLSARAGHWNVWTFYTMRRSCC